MSDTYNFNFYETTGEFINWFLPELLVSVDPDTNRTAPVAINDSGKWDELEKATDKWSKVELGLTINGIPVDAEYAFGRIREEMSRQAELKAKEYLENVAKVYDFENFVEELTKSLESGIRSLAAERGITIPERDSWGYFD